MSSPAAGTVYRWPGCCGDDFVCVSFDSGGSAAIGYLSNRAVSGTRISGRSRIGTVAWPHASNGDYAHIHVQVHQGPNCTEGSEPVAFDVAHGFKWRCTPDLPYSGSVNQYSGLAVDRCGSPIADETTISMNQLNGGLGEASWLTVLVSRLIRVVGSFMAGSTDSATTYAGSI
ncbi:MAG: hypothetical protein ACR2KQ_06505 [Actinomycetota bacterium]